MTAGPGARRLLRQVPTTLGPWSVEAIAPTVLDLQGPWLISTEVVTLVGDVLHLEAELPLGLSWQEAITAGVPPDAEEQRAAVVACLRGTALAHAVGLGLGAPSHGDVHLGPDGARLAWCGVRPLDGTSVDRAADVRGLLALLGPADALDPAVALAVADPGTDAAEAARRLEEAFGPVAAAPVPTVDDRSALVRLLGDDEFVVPVVPQVPDEPPAPDFVRALDVSLVPDPAPGADVSLVPDAASGPDEDTVELPVLAATVDRPRLRVASGWALLGLGVAVAGGAVVLGVTGRSVAPVAAADLPPLPRVSLPATAPGPSEGGATPTVEDSPAPGIVPFQADDAGGTAVPSPSPGGPSPSPGLLLPATGGVRGLLVALESGCQVPLDLRPADRRFTAGVDRGVTVYREVATYASPDADRLSTALRTAARRCPELYTPAPTVTHWQVRDASNGDPSVVQLTLQRVDRLAPPLAVAVLRQDETLVTVVATGLSGTPVADVLDRVVRGSTA